MATKRAAPQPQPPPPVPSGEEVVDAIFAWRQAASHLAEWRLIEEEARRHMVDVLHRAGVQGLSL